MTSKKELPRLEIEHSFKFNCAPRVPCFTDCCQDVTIVLTPYDIIRMKKAAALSSGDFIDKYTIIRQQKDCLIPLVILKMDEETKKCQFVSEKGCAIYAERPWPCRMFPLSLNDDGTYSVIAAETKCKGLCEDVNLKVEDWLVGQGVPIYDEINRLFSEVTIPLSAQKLDIDNPKVFQMVFMSLYNIDKFKDFVFKSSFLNKFIIDDARIEAIKKDDLELLKFSFDWVKFGVLGQKTLVVKSDANK